ncbi:MAG: hypothetical protein OXF23_07290 [Candidatus Dadabacteria bacterium]|nr:hypothetical protein [Candidatus Dadabacteria bacterium]MCY4262853.1 hypothetical protein [Candidatus Dadabacteria bacterium]
MERITILSGLSGQGKSTAAKVLEDLCFFCVDNLTPELIFSFINLCGKSYLTLGIGCTGGKHGSGVITEALGESLYEYSAIIRHRDINKL